MDEDSESYSERAGLATFKPFRHPWNLFMAFRNAKILTVEVVMFLYFFGIYLSGPLTQQYYLNRYSLDILKNTSYPYSSETHCIKKDDVNNYTCVLNHTTCDTYDGAVTHHATNLYIYGNLANRVAAITVTMILGPISDHYGRRLPIILVCLGAGLSGLLNLVIILYSLNMYFFILSGVIAGLFGDFSSLLMACYSYVSDISHGKWRTVRIGVLEGVQFMSGLVAQGLGGLWFQKLDCDFTYPVLLYIIVNLTTVLYALVYLPESLASKKRRAKNAGKPTGPKLLLRGASIFCCQVQEYPVWRLWFSIIPFVVMVVNVTGAMSLNVFFFSDLNWSPALIGAYQATTMGSNMVATFVILPLLAFMKLPDVLISLIGVFFGSAMNLFLGLSTKVYQVFIVAVIQGMDAVMIPPLRGYMSKIVHVEDQGALFSIMSSIESVFTMVSIIYVFLLPKIIDQGLTPGTAFIIMAAFGLVPIPFLCVLLFHRCFTARRGAGDSENAALLYSGKSKRKLNPTIIND